MVSRRPAIVTGIEPKMFAGCDNKKKLLTGLGEQVGVGKAGGSYCYNINSEQLE